MGIGDSLSGRLLLLDALAMQWRSIRLNRDASCRVCATRP
jgi:adenylyltransferase/sulfurtransferase